MCRRQLCFFTFTWSYHKHNEEKSIYTQSYSVCSYNYIPLYTVAREVFPETGIHQCQHSNTPGALDI